MALVRGYDWCLNSKLRRVLPARRFMRGSWPGITGGEALGPTTNGDKQWVFPNVEISDKEKRMIVGEVMRLSVEILFKTHCYSFKGKVFKQQDGGPIGLRSTCAIARVVMGRHSQKWRAAMAKNNVALPLTGSTLMMGGLLCSA